MRRIVLLLLVFAASMASALEFDAVTPGKALEFPRDRGAHPGHRIEWWYVTGHLESPRGPLGFQVTFFRLRNRDAEKDPGRFSPAQVIFAHAALADPGRGRFLHDQRTGRVLAALVEARTDDTGVRLDGWSLTRASDAYQARIEADGFTLDLALTPTQPALLQGDRGFSRKGAAPGQASYYYSEPQLRVSGSVGVKGDVVPVTGVAWLDHEWSTEYLAPDAKGWDWLGANLDDGGALMAFRMRGKDGKIHWAGGTYRPPSGPPQVFGPGDVRFTVRREWTSPRSGTSYPVEMEIQVGDRTFLVKPLMDDQELDARASTGTLYWEGAVRVEGLAGASGRGYLELTGYAERVPF